jgi:23S rRNA (cytidine1920-2'-O)/16S rRNA (cytidine1409-2'-O)-methyltransferase
LLEAGAKRIYAVDAGHGQLLGRLRNEPRIVNLENTNLGDFGPTLVGDTIEVITADLSYLALSDAAGQLGEIDIALDADLVVLVKADVRAAAGKTTFGPWGTSSRCSIRHGGNRATRVDPASCNDKSGARPTRRY